VVVVGGGPAGAVAALVLARRGVRVTMLEARAGPAWKVGETLPPAAAPLLRQLGLDDVLRRDGHLQAEGNRAVWGSDRAVDRAFLARPQGPGWHLDRRRFEARLASAACRAGVDWRWGWRVVRCVRSPAGGAERAGSGLAGGRSGAAGPRSWRIELCERPEAVEAPDPGRLDGAAARPRGGLLEADWLLDATGRRAHVARQVAGARRVRYDRLVGVAALLGRPEGDAEGETGAAFAGAPPPPAPRERRGEDWRAPAGAAPDGYTLVEATPDGWWYSAALADGRLAVVLFGDGDLLERSLLGPHPDREVWRRRLLQVPATRERVERLGPQPPAQLTAIPAESSRLDRIAGRGWLALGDAAAAHDPLSSHGMTAAMGSGFYGGHAVADLLAGHAEAEAAYLDVMERSYSAYLDLLREHYAAERRWPEAPFWRRRHQPAYAQEPL
jgi:flavin-dependent dehydrogenase